MIRAACGGLMDGIQAIRREKNLSAIVVNRCSNVRHEYISADHRVRGIISPNPCEVVVITDGGDADELFCEIVKAGTEARIERGLSCISVFGDSMLGREATGAKLLSRLHLAGIKERFISLCEIVFAVYLNESDCDTAWKILKEEI